MAEDSRKDRLDDVFLTSFFGDCRGGGLLAFDLGCLLLLDRRATKDGGLGLAYSAMLLLMDLNDFSDRVDRTDLAEMTEWAERIDWSGVCDLSE